MPSINYLSHTSPWGMPTTPWAQSEPRSDTQDLWCHWWEGPSNPSVDEGPRRWERPYPRRRGVTRVRPWARRYGTLSGALSGNNAMGQHWPEDGTRDCQESNKHNFVNTCPKWGKWESHQHLREMSMSIEWLHGSIRDRSKKKCWSEAVGRF